MSIPVLGMKKSGTDTVQLFFILETAGKRL